MVLGDGHLFVLVVMTLEDNPLAPGSDVEAQNRLDDVDWSEGVQRGVCTYGRTWVPSLLRRARMSLLLLFLAYLVLLKENLPITSSALIPSAIGGVQMSLSLAGYTRFANPLFALQSVSLYLLSLNHPSLHPYIRALHCYSTRWYSLGSNRLQCWFEIL